MKLAALALGMACTLGAVTLEEVARLAPKEPVRPAPKALKDAVRAWAEPQFLSVRNPLPVATVMKAALERAGLEKVVLIKDGKAAEKTVTTGRRDGGWVEITAGLNAGENVVLEPAGIRTGQSLLVANPNAAPTTAQTNATR